MSKLLLAFAALTMLLSACTSDPPPPPQPPTPTAPVVSDEVPTLEELRQSGLSDEQAACFTSTIDPDSTGRVASAELFMQALTECT